MITPAIRLPAPEDARRGAMAQFGVVADAVEALPDKAFRRKTRLGAWTVAHLVAHLVSNVDALTRALDHPPPDDKPMLVLDYLGSMRTVAPAVAERAVELAKGVPPTELRERMRTAVTDVTEALLGVSLARVVGVRLGAIHLSGFLVTRCVETVVHGLDLAAATGVEVTPDPTALAVVVKVFAAMLVQAAPGPAVEVRIPGQVAVQCVEGPRHTRGTPPNVVEADPLPFVEVCAGRMTWDEAVAKGGIRASGERSNLSEHFPLIG